MNLSLVLFVHRVVAAPLEFAWDVGVRLRLEQAWPDFGRGEIAPLDEALFGSIRRMVADCHRLDQNDGGLRATNLVWVINALQFRSDLVTLGEYWSSTRRCPSGFGRYAHRIAVHAHVRYHPIARMFVAHEIRHAHDDLTGYGYKSLGGLSLTAALERRSRIAEVHVLAQVPAKTRAAWLRAHEHRTGPSFMNVDQRFVTRLRAVERRDNHALFDEVLEDHYLEQIRCEMNLHDRRLRGPVIALSPAQSIPSR